MLPHMFVHNELSAIMSRYGWITNKMIKDISSICVHYLTLNDTWIFRKPYELMSIVYKQSVGRSVGR